MEEVVIVPPLPAAQVKPKRRGASGLALAWERNGPNDRKGLEKCDFCRNVFTTNNGHGCKAVNFISDAETQRVSTTCHKQFLTSFLTQHDASRATFARKWIAKKALQQHRIRYVALLLLYAFVAHATHNVSLENVSTYVLRVDSKKRKRAEEEEEKNEEGPPPLPPSPPLKLDQTIMHTALSLSCSKLSKAVLACTKPLSTFYRDHFRPHLPDSISSEL